MSGFGAGSGFGGFGASNQQQQNSGFGTGTGSGFGNTGGSGFGSGTSPSPFGAQASTFGTSGGFGSGGGFGTPTTQANPMFGGQSKGFGATTTATGTTGSNMFGQGTSGFGGTGFGTGAATGTGSAFGGTTNTGTGNVFGANTQTSGFGATSQQAGSIFGGGSTTGSGFGTSGGFGSGTALAGTVPPAPGTANPTFSALEEKDPSSSVICHYQSVSCMQPYQKYSFEELRAADYDQGRRYGNASGQPGAFGSSAFGGFPQSTGGFGAQTNTASNPFGGTPTTNAASGFGQPATSGFGATTSSNPLFGATKPANSLFGQTSTSQPSGFGTTTTTAGGFGSTGSPAFGGGNMFGSQQNKPTGFGASTTGTGFGGFGQPATTSSSPFGAATATASPFGQAQQGTTGGFGGFGQSQQQQQNKPAFSGFGTNTQQPQQQQGNSLFATGNTGTSGFGTSLGQQTGSSIFGSAPQQGAAANNPFGGQQQQHEQKPNPFGSLASATSTPNSNLFGGFGAQASQPQQQQQQQGGGGLFGNANQQQQKPSLFGTGQTGSMFGTQNTAPAATGTPLFNLGASQNTQQQGGLPLGGSSIFGASQQQTQQQPQNVSLQASLLDGNPYGNQSIFSGLPMPNAQSPGPLATPLSASIKQKQRTPLPMYKVSPSAANRLITPPTRPGYGFSYSTYGSPSSIAGTPTGLGGSLLSRSFNGGSLGRSFSKSLSASTLRRSFEPETESILSPGALSPGGSRYSGSNLKRLTIDRSLRTDLFSRSTQSPAAIANGIHTPQQSSKLKKRVSFDSPADNEPSNSKAESALIPIVSESPEPTPEELGYLRSSRNQHRASIGLDGTKEVDGVVASPANQNTENPDKQPEMEQIKGKELAIVPEGREPEPSTPSKPEQDSVPETDPQPGDYWIKPTREQINKMSRELLKQVPNFTVGRANCGMVTFNKPVDLTSVNLDDVTGKIVKIGVRSITVYPEEGSKPPRGKGLNVPSTLTIENSWPRGRERKSSSPSATPTSFDRHIERLKRVTNTEFVKYDKKTGVWVFKVMHFTTYGLDYDDDEGENHDQSTTSARPDMATPKAHTPSHNLGSEFNDSMISVDDTFDDSMMAIEDDTFEFKKRGSGPGPLGNRGGVKKSVAFESDEESFLEEGSMGSGSENEYVEESDGLSVDASEPESDRDETMDMAGAFPIPNYTMEQLNRSHSPQKSNITQQQVLTLDDLQLDLTGNWTEQLQRTISPRKQNRQALREAQKDVFADRTDPDDTPKAKAFDKDRGIVTSIDLMNSLFRPRQSSPRKSQAVKTQKGFEWPYAKKPKTFAGSLDDMSEADANFHTSLKPRWSRFDTLLLLESDGDSESDNEDEDHEDRTTVFYKTYEREEPGSLLLQKAHSSIELVDKMPFASLSVVNFIPFIDNVQEESKEADLERRVWQLLYILFNDDIEDDISASVPEALHKQFLHRIKKDRLSLLWETIIRQSHSDDLKSSMSPEERAMAYLCTHRVEDACKVLIENGNPHLATLISQIGRDPTIRKDMKTQIESWRDQNVLSEMTEPIRALYELVAGNCLRSEGKPNVAIEDRTSAFDISKRFGLDWVQAFGLRLWYGISEDEPIEAAVNLFQHDIFNGKETAYPFSPVYNRPNSDTKAPDSPLWVILKTYAAARHEGSEDEFQPIHIPQDIMPEAVSHDILRNRLSFQLCQHLRKVVRPSSLVVIDDSRTDQLTLNYAWETAASNDYGVALFILLHLSRAVDRERSVKELLCQFGVWLPAPVLDDGKPSNMWKYITEELRVPSEWLWAAKALYARSERNWSGEVEYLIQAQRWNEAHDSFCRVVAPQTVIRRDYETLKSLIESFGDSPERRIREWPNEGGMYRDFLALVNVPEIRKDQMVMRRLVSTLISVGEKLEKNTMASFEEKVAVREIGRLVAEWCTKDLASTVQSADILRLPMTSDARRLHAAEVSKRYYRAIMAAGA